MIYNLIVKVYENKHSGESYKCDEQRMYNKESNKNILLSVIEKYLDLEVDNNKLWNDYGLKVEYLFY